MNDYDLVWRTTRAAANTVAGAQGRPARKVFDDSLSAEVARIQVRRILMKRFPKLSALQRGELIAELTEDFDV